jgi:inosine-uridine nucleoside N-ribohydrolase
VYHQLEAGWSRWAPDAAGCEALSGQSVAGPKGQRETEQLETINDLQMNYLRPLLIPILTAAMFSSLTQRAFPGTMGSDADAREISRKLLQVREELPVESSNDKAISQHRDESVAAVGQTAPPYKPWTRANPKTEVRVQLRKLIIDCDPGIDDAIALVLAMQCPDFEILGITTTFGNAQVEQTTKNALRIVETSGKRIPVHRGADKPLSVPLRPPPDFVHGKDGLGNTGQPEPTTKANAKPAAQFLVETAKTYPGEVTILAIGPLSNLAEALRLDSGFARNVRELIVMGGALYVPGNVTPVAEANIYGDPHAADLVFTASWKVTMIGLDVTTKVQLSDQMLSRVRTQNKTFGLFIWSISRFYAEFHRQEHIPGGIYPHDPSAVVYLIEPGIFRTKQGPLRVVCEGMAIGQTIIAAYDHHFQQPPWKDQPLVTAATTIDTNRFQEMIERLLIDDRR